MSHDFIPSHQSDNTLSSKGSLMRTRRQESLTNIIHPWFVDLPLALHTREQHDSSGFLFGGSLGTCLCEFGYANLTRCMIHPVSPLSRFRITLRSPRILHIRTRECARPPLNTTPSHAERGRRFGSSFAFGCHYSQSFDWDFQPT